MEMTLEGYVSANKIKQLQELVKQYGLCFSYSPYPKNPTLPEGEWYYSVNYSGVNQEQSKAFDDAWERLNTPIVETVKKPSLLKRLVSLLPFRI